jgi:hypothetical protein
MLTPSQMQFSTFQIEYQLKLCNGAFGKSAHLINYFVQKYKDGISIYFLSYKEIKCDSMIETLEYLAAEQ